MCYFNMYMQRANDALVHRVNATHVPILRMYVTFCAWPSRTPPNRTRLPSQWTAVRLWARGAGPVVSRCSHVRVAGGGGGRRGRVMRSGGGLSRHCMGTCWEDIEPSSTDVCVFFIHTTIEIKLLTNSTVGGGREGDNVMSFYFSVYWLTLA